MNRVDVAAVADAYRQWRVDRDRPRHPVRLNITTATTGTTDLMPQQRDLLQALQALGIAVERSMRRR